MQIPKYFYFRIKMDEPPTIKSADPIKPMTNADKIRHMTDEELAFYVFNHPQWVDLDGYLNWLKQEVESDG